MRIRRQKNGPRTREREIPRRRNPRGDLFRGNESGATFLFIDRDIIILDAA